MIPLTATDQIPEQKWLFRDVVCCVSRRGSRGGGRWGGRSPLGRKDPRRRRGFPRLKGRKKGHWCLLNGCSTPFRHNMAIHILKSCKSVFAYVKNRSLPSHKRSSFPWRPPLAEILDSRLVSSRTQTQQMLIHVGTANTSLSRPYHYRRYELIRIFGILAPEKGKDQ